MDKSNIFNHPNNFVVDYSDFRNDLNVQSVREQILHKNSNIPYFATGSTVKNVVTDMDHFPYTRWFRGIHDFPEPIVAEREAGYRKPENRAYAARIPIEPDEPNRLCFQPACSTVYPCYADEKRPQKKTRTQMNDQCITFSP
jgi:hypothetical protein